jgi:hypothetical protein
MHRGRRSLAPRALRRVQRSGRPPLRGGAAASSSRTRSTSSWCALPRLAADEQADDENESLVSERVHERCCQSQPWDAAGPHLNERPIPYYDRAA